MELKQLRLVVGMVPLMAVLPPQSLPKLPTPTPCSNSEPGNVPDTSDSEKISWWRCSVENGGKVPDILVSEKTL